MADEVYSQSGHRTHALLVPRHSEGTLIKGNNYTLRGVIAHSSLDYTIIEWENVSSNKMENIHKCPHDITVRKSKENRNVTPKERFLATFSP